MKETHPADANALDSGLSQPALDAGDDGLVTRDLTMDVLVEGELDAASDLPDAGDFDAATDVLMDGGFDAPTNDAAPSDVQTDGGTLCPPPPAPCLILPLGDSITDGFVVPGGYRVPLFRRVLLAGQHATFVGSQQNGPAQVDGVAFPRDHEGHVGFAIDPFAGRQGISPLTPGALRTYQPQIVTLMIGTNDMDLQFDVANAPGRLGALLDSIFQTAPGVAVVVAQITPTSDDALNQRIAAFNAAMPALVGAHASAGRHIQLVDMYGAMTSVAGYQTALLTDRLHPNEAGYALMADVWYRALAAMLR